uniref:SDR family NAD(P)-dependent oxidoreductase n=1 Tax=Gorillibacterium massiliense TaxID=1280390 RepID=UPI000593869B
MRLSGKVAIVTGAASGMGKAIAERYAAEGAKVTVSDLRLETAETVVSGIKAKGGEAFAVAANVAKEEDVQQLFDKTVETYGTVDILVNNAGIMDNFYPAAEVTDDLWDRVI